MKDGIASTLEKTFVSVGYTPHLKLRTLLECLKHFTTNSKHTSARFPLILILPFCPSLSLSLFSVSSHGFLQSTSYLWRDTWLSELCCNKLAKVGIVHLLMRIFERWERFDGPMRLKICNYALNTLQHLCVISKFGEPREKFPNNAEGTALQSLSLFVPCLFNELLKVTPLCRCRNRQEGYQVKQRSTATVPVLHELSGRQSLRLPAVSYLRYNQSVSGKEGITGARNVAREVNERFEVVRGPSCDTFVILRSVIEV